MACTYLLEERIEEEGQPMCLCRFKAEPRRGSYNSGQRCVGYLTLPGVANVWEGRYIDDLAKRCPLYSTLPLSIEKLSAIKEAMSKT